MAWLDAVMCCSMSTDPASGKSERGCEEQGLSQPVRLPAPRWIRGGEVQPHGRSTNLHGISTLQTSLSSSDRVLLIWLCNIIGEYRKLVEPGVLLREVGVFILTRR